MRGNCFTGLSAFLAVAEQGSFTKAAAQLGISKGSLSHSIRGIEERLGVRLLNRTTRSVAPTEAGERMLARLRPLFDDLSATVDEINEFRDRPAGHLRLTMPRPVASFVIAPLLARFMAQYPEIVVDISVSPALTDIVAGRFDALRRAASTPASSDAEVLLARGRVEREVGDGDSALVAFQGYVAHAGNRSLGHRSIRPAPRYVRPP